VKVCSSSVNPVEASGRAGHVPFSLPRILGGDLAGVVAAADEGSAFKQGDRVAALTPGERASWCLAHLQLAVNSALDAYHCCAVLTLCCYLVHSLQYQRGPGTAQHVVHGSAVQLAGCPTLLGSCSIAALDGSVNRKRCFVLHWV
jgi:hypothetical protein